MKKTLITPLVLLLALIALVAAGCGGDDDGDGSSSTSAETTATTDTSATTEATGDPLSEEDYAQELVDVLGPLGTELQTLGAGVGSDSDGSEALTGAEDVLNETIDQLNTIVPPEGAEDLNSDLIGVLEDYRDTVTDTAEALDGASPEEQTQIGEDFAAASQDFATAFQDLGTQFDDAGIALNGAG